MICFLQWTREPRKGVDKLTNTYGLRWPLYKITAQSTGSQMDSEQVASKASLLVFLSLYGTCTASGLHHPKGTVSGGLYPGARLAQRGIDAVSKPQDPALPKHTGRWRQGVEAGGNCRKAEFSMNLDHPNLPWSSAPPDTGPSVGPVSVLCPAHAGARR